MKRPLLIAGLVGLLLCSFETGADANQSPSNLLLNDEIMLHVLNECDLFSLYQKNRIDFKPVDVAFLLADLRKSSTEWRLIRNRIRAEVGRERSFYRRALMYDVNYKRCIRQIEQEEAGRTIQEIKEMPVDSRITAADSTVQSLYSTRDDALRAKRDRAKI